MLVKLGNDLYYTSENNIEKYRFIYFRMHPTDRIFDKKDIGFAIMSYQCNYAMLDNRKYLGSLEDVMLVYGVSTELYEEVCDFFYKLQFKPKYLKLLYVLQKYTYNEFRSIDYHTIDDIPNIINLAFTTTESGKSEVQVDFNLEQFQWEKYINGNLEMVIKSDLKDFINELEDCSFEYIVSDILYLAEQKEGAL